MKIAIIGAMKEEIDPMLKKFKNYKTIKYRGNCYYKTNYKDLDIVIVHSGIGKVLATLTTTILIEKFGCELVLFSGVAGALNPELEIGQLIIASKLCQHDADVSKFGYKFGEIPGEQIYTQADKNLLAKAKETAKKLGQNAFCGVIASGDQFISTQKKKEFIRNEFEADAIDMESSAVSVVCKKAQIPFLIIRSISDKAQENSDIDFEKFLQKAVNNSADFLFELLKEIEIESIY